MTRRLRIAALAAVLGVAGGLGLTVPALAATAPSTPTVSPAVHTDSGGTPICVAVTWLNWGDCITVFQR